MTRGPAREKKPLGLVVDAGAVVPPPEALLEALVQDELRGPVSELVRQVVVELVPRAAERERGSQSRVIGRTGR